MIFSDTLSSDQDVLSKYRQKNKAPKLKSTEELREHRELLEGTSKQTGEKSRSSSPPSCEYADNATVCNDCTVTFPIHS